MAQKREGKGQNFAIYGYIKHCTKSKFCAKRDRNKYIGPAF